MEMKWNDKKNKTKQNKTKNDKLMKWKRTTKVAQSNKMQWMMIEYNNNNNETFIKKKQKINNCVCFLIRTFPLSPWLIRFPEEL